LDEKPEVLMNILWGSPRSLIFDQCGWSDNHDPENLVPAVRAGEIIANGSFEFSPEKGELFSSLKVVMRKNGGRYWTRTKKCLWTGRGRVCRDVAAKMKVNASGHLEAHTGHEKDTFGASTCGADVTQNEAQNLPLDFLRLAMLWEQIPIKDKTGLDD
jgi:hypothetical protein